MTSVNQDAFPGPLSVNSLRIWWTAVYQETWSPSQELLKSLMRKVGTSVHTTVKLFCEIRTQLNSKLFYLVSF